MSDKDCRKCRVGKFKNALCSNDICKTFGAVGNEEDFIRLFTRQRGEWIKATESIWKCSLCNGIMFVESKYCPFCGADMTGVDR